MKTIFTAALLLALHLYAFSQTKSLPKPEGELHIGYFRETFKMRDQQVSPMMYVANLNGLRISYGRITPRNQWIADTKFGLADFISPSLGIRQFKFSDDQQEPMYLVPTLYRGELTLTYRRLLNKKSHFSSWAGVQVQETANYADGVAMTTWVMNTLAVNFNYQAQFHLHNRHTILADISLPVISIVSRLPYSNAVSRPEISNTRAFLKNSSFETINHFMNPQLNIAYRFHASRRVSLQASYRYSWLRFPEPQIIRSASHTGNLSIIYQFQFQNK